jgi:membrane protease YdiL (CAAX protease family)
MFYNNNKKSMSEPFDAKQGGLSFSFMIATYVIVAFFVQAVLQLVTEKTSVLYLAISSILSLVAITVILVYQCYFKKQTIKVLSLNKFNAQSLLLSILLWGGMFFGAGFVNLKLGEVLVGAGLKVPQTEIPLNNIWQFLLFTLTLAILPAIFEELFFRGLLLSSLDGHSTITKVVAVGLCFALYHCNLAQFAYQFLNGVTFCLLAIYAKSIIPCIIAHFINNFFIILCEYLGIYIDLFSPILIAIGLVALLGFLFITCVFNKNKENKKSNKTTKKEIAQFYLLYGALGIFICALMIITALFA